ncbi:hypothetical protein BHE74_00041463 [Ensete ventricosum]|nr:hypothetical protein BHE74_00041463 [Ensete ventricosum]
MGNGSRATRGRRGRLGEYRPVAACPRIGQLPDRYVPGSTGLTTRFWQPNSKSKKAIIPKGQTKRSNCIIDTESGKTRHSIRTSPASNVGAGQTNPSYEPEKTKRTVKKVPTSPAESVQEHPQSELERVKRNLRKISTAVKDASEVPDVETQKSNLSSQKVDAGLSENPGHGGEESIEKPKKDNSPTPTLETYVETALETVIAGPVDLLLDDQSTNELQLLQQIDNAENHVAMSGELSLKEEQLGHENQKISKRRSSFSTKSEYAENGMSNTPVLPSYMAATESAKAKLRGQISPRFVSESVDKNGFTRRHSLPSTNGKMSSPRTKRLIQTGGKGGIVRDVNGGHSYDRGNKKGKWQADGVGSRRKQRWVDQGYGWQRERRAATRIRAMAIRKWVR